MNFPIWSTGNTSRSSNGYGFSSELKTYGGKKCSKIPRSSTVRPTWLSGADDEFDKLLNSTLDKSSNVSNIGAIKFQKNDKNRLENKENRVLCKSKKNNTSSTRLYDDNEQYDFDLRLEDAKFIGTTAAKKKRPFKRSKFRERIHHKTIAQKALRRKIQASSTPSKDIVRSDITFNCSKIPQPMNQGTSKLFDRYSLFKKQSLDSKNNDRILQTSLVLFCNNTASNSATESNYDRSSRTSMCSNDDISRNSVMGSTYDQSSRTSMCSNDEISRNTVMGSTYDQSSRTSLCCYDNTDDLNSAAEYTSLNTSTNRNQLTSDFVEYDELHDNDDRHHMSIVESLPTDQPDTSITETVDEDLAPLFEKSLNISRSSVSNSTDNNYTPDMSNKIVHSSYEQNDVSEYVDSFLQESSNETTVFYSQESENKSTAKCEEKQLENLSQYSVTTESYDHSLQLDDESYSSSLDDEKTNQHSSKIDNVTNTELNVNDEYTKSSYGENSFEVEQEKLVDSTELMVRSTDNVERCDCNNETTDVTSLNSSPDDENMTVIRVTSLNFEDKCSARRNVRYEENRLKDLSQCSSTTINNSSRNHSVQQFRTKYSPSSSEDETADQGSPESNKTKLLDSSNENSSEDDHYESAIDSSMIFIESRDYVECHDSTMTSCIDEDDSASLRNTFDNQETTVIGVSSQNVGDQRSTIQDLPNTFVEANTIIIGESNRTHHSIIEISSDGDSKLRDSSCGSETQIHFANDTILSTFNTSSVFSSTVLKHGANDDDDDDENNDNTTLSNSVTDSCLDTTVVGRKTCLDVRSSDSCSENTLIYIDDTANSSNCENSNKIETTTYATESPKREDTVVVLLDSQSNLLCSSSTSDIEEVSHKFPSQIYLDGLKNVSTRRYDGRSRYTQSKNNVHYQLPEIIIEECGNDEYGERSGCEISSLTHNLTSTRTFRKLHLEKGKNWRRSYMTLKHLADDKSSQIDLEVSEKGRLWKPNMTLLVNKQMESDKENMECSVWRTPVNFSQSSLSPGLKTFHNTNHSVYSTIENSKHRGYSISYPANDSDTDDTFDEEEDETNVENINAYTTFLDNMRESYLSSNTLSISFSPLNRTFSESAKDMVMLYCQQVNPLPFNSCYSDELLQNCRKIGEGVYGEVFMLKYRSRCSVLKIIPIEGEKIVNGERQKKYEEILSELVISIQLSNLRRRRTFYTDCFAEVKNCRCVFGKYPPKLITLWKDYDKRKGSENDSPKMFDDDQIYMVLELDFAGEDLESFSFANAQQSLSVFNQVTNALAVAEKAFMFEHRDLHWGNVLVTRTSNKETTFIVGNERKKIKLYGIKVTIIDYTLSRITINKRTLYNNLGADPELFMAEGDFQFEVYRQMKNVVEDVWDRFSPRTNVLWLYYLLDKFLNEVKYQRPGSRMHNNALPKLRRLVNVVSTFSSAYDFSNDT